MTAYKPPPGDGAFDFDPEIVPKTRYPRFVGQPDPEPPKTTWFDLAGLIVSVTAVPAAALVCAVATLTTWGPNLTGREPVLVTERVAQNVPDVETTGSTGWRLRDGFEE